MPDTQSGHEKTITGLLPAFAGANTLYGAGMLELGVTFSMEQFVIDCDIITMIRKAMAGIPVNDETLAVDAIKEVGAGNDFIGHPTTMANMDLPSDPMVINRDMIGDWRAAGRKTLAEAAHDIVEEVLKTHVVAPLDPEVDAKMKAVVKKADDAFLQGA